MFDNFPDDFDLFREGSFYTVKKIVRKIKNNESQIVSVYLDFPCDSQFHIKLTTNGIAVHNSHISTMKKKSYHALQLTVADLKYFEEVFSHWNRIKDRFIHEVSHGAPMIGHISTSYYYPDGHEVEYEKGDKKKPKAVKGDPFDKKFPSDSCLYLDGYPFTQHYKHGRFDFMLEKNRYHIEDERSIQILEFNQPEKVVELLKFVEYDPDTAIRRILT